jgi:integrase
VSGGELDGARASGRAVSPATHDQKSHGSPLADEVGGNYNGQHSREVADLLANYTPRMPAAQWLAIADFTRACVSDMAVAKSARYARAHLSPTAHLVHWATQTASLDFDREEIFHPSTIARFVETQRSNREGNTKQTLTKTLLRMSRTLTGSKPEDFRRPTLRLPTLAPHDDSDFARLASWAEGQTNPDRRRIADAMLAFTLGAGLKPAELGAARREDVTFDDSGISITVHEITPRTVPVHALWADRAQSAFDRSEPGEYLVMPARPRTSRHIDFARYSRRVGEVVPNGTDLRATWVVRAVDLLHPRAAAHFAGIKHSGGLQPYFPHTRRIDFENSTALLRGTGDRW